MGAAELNERSTRRVVLGWLAVAFVLRCVVAIGLHLWLGQQPDRDYLIAGDAEGYWELGIDLAEGRPYEIYTPPRRALRMPGFPLLIAGTVRLLGPSRLAVRLVLAVVGTITCGLVYLLAREFRSHPDDASPVWALGIASLAPIHVGFTPVLLSESLFACLLTASLLSMAMWLRTRTFSRRAFGAVIVGVSIAAATYVRPVWLLLAPAFAVFHLLLGDRLRAESTSQTFWQRGLWGILVTAVTVLVLLPWGMRNERVTGHFTLTTWWLGPSLYDSLSPDATGVSDMTFFDADGLQGTLSEYEIDQHYRRKAIRFARENPGDAVRLGFVKLLRFWSPWPNADQFQSPGPIVITVLAFGVIFGSAAVGLIVLLHENSPAAERVWTLLITIGPILYLTLLHMVFIGSLRYRLPVECPVLVLSGIGANHLWRRWGVRTKP